MSKPRLMILDANALLHRAWHALPPLTNPQGQVVNAVYGVLMVVMKLLAERKPDCFVACWDTEAPTFRHEEYKAYKAQREEQPQELYDQIPLLQESLALLGVQSLSLDGFEADDLIATTALRGKSAGWDVEIVTGDRDTLQLVQPGIAVRAFKKGVSETILFDEAEVVRQFELKPEQMIDYKAMRGDPSDNLPGVRGIGEKGATDLLKKFGTLEEVFKAAHDRDSELSPAMREKLLAGEKDAAAMVHLVKLVSDVPLEWQPKSGVAINADGLREFLMRQGFKSLINRIPIQTANSPGPSLQKRGVETLSAFEKISIETDKQAEKAIKELKKTGEIVLLTARGVSGSLFAQAVEGLIIGAGEKLYVFAPKTLAMLKPLLADATVKKISHDIKAEMAVLESLKIEVNGWSFDTMLAAYLLGAGERNHDLPAVAMRYANFDLAQDAPPLRQAEAICRVAPILAAALKEEKLDTILSRFELPLVPILRQMERAGILIDRSYLTNLSHELGGDKLALEKKMFKAAGREFNPASPAQLADVLFVTLNLPTKGIKKGKTGFSTAAPELEKLRGTHPLIEMIEEHRELAKLLSTYVEVLPTLADKEGRVHTTYNQAVTSTGRLSSSDPNLQNIPIRTEVGRKIRRAFIARPGFVLLSADYSQIELRLVAALAHDEKMLEAFRRGDDIHSATAAAIWNVPLDQVTKDQRRAAKAVNFGIIYGQGPMGLSMSAGVSMSEAKKFIAAYFENYSGIKNYMDQTRAMVAKLGYVETLFGRRRQIPEIGSALPQVRAAAERMAINMPVQGTAADLLKLAMIALDKKLVQASKNTRLLLQVHDELVFEVPETEVVKVAVFVKENMENVEKIGVPIVVEVKTGKNWDEMEKL